MSSLLYAAVRENFSPHNDCFYNEKGLIPHIVI